MIKDLFDGFNSIRKAFKLQRDVKNSQKMQFKSKQSELYAEGLTIYLLRDQLQKVAEMIESDPAIKAVIVQISLEGVHYLDEVIPSLPCEVSELSDNRYLLSRRDVIV